MCSYRVFLLLRNGVLVQYSKESLCPSLTWLMFLLPSTAVAMKLPSKTVKPDGYLNTRPLMYGNAHAQAIQL